MRARLRLSMFAGALCLASCSQQTGFRIVNETGAELVIIERSATRKARFFDVAPGMTSRRLSISYANRYELSRAGEQPCRVAYPSILEGRFPLPLGRRVLDGVSPIVATLVVIDREFVARAYPNIPGAKIDPLTEYLRDGFPAKPVRDCSPVIPIAASS